MVTVAAIMIVAAVVQSHRDTAEQWKRSQTRHNEVGTKSEWLACTASWW